MSEKKLPNILKPNKLKVKSDKSELNQRVKEIQELKLSGFTRSYIIQYGSKWGVSDRQIDDYIIMATKVMKEINAISIQDSAAMICSNLWDLYRKAGKAGNLAEQHKILMSMAKLKGLDQITINHVIQDVRDLETMSDDDLDSLLESGKDVTPVE